MSEPLHEQIHDARSGLCPIEVAVLGCQGAEVVSFCQVKVAVGDEAKLGAQASAEGLPGPDQAFR